MRGEYDVCIIGGCGHVGLPLGLAFANHKKKVVLFDINQANVEKVNRKEMPFLDKGAPEILTKTVDSGLLEATTDKTVISRSKNIIMVIGTPVDEHLNPNLLGIITAIKNVKDLLHKDQLLVLRSTIYPGITKKVHSYLKSVKCGISLAFCPERVTEGFALEEIRTLPQIVSAYDKATLKLASKLFSALEVETVELTPEEAELVKLFSNTWRYINFATANQFFMIAENCGVDFYKVYKGMTYNYPRLKGFPKAGYAAGPCLFKDTMQLSAFDSNHFFLGHSAMLVNEGLPAFVINRLKRNVDLSKKTVGILGMAFKADSDDPRESLSYKFKKILELEAKKVLCSDLYIQNPDFVDAEELIRRSDIVILAAPHRAYKKLKLKNKHVVDIWNFFDSV